MSLVPYQGAYQPGALLPTGVPVVQPGVIQPVIPAGYVGANTALDYYGQSAYPGYDYGTGYGYRGGLGYRGSRGYYPRKRGRLSRMMEALFLGSETDRLRAIEIQHEMGYMPGHPAAYAGYGMAPGYGMSPGYAMGSGYGMGSGYAMGPGPYSLGARALIDDPYLPPYGGRGLYGGRCSIPHRRGLTCPECDDYY